jgi:hypothetical protein
MLVRAKRSGAITLLRVRHNVAAAPEILAKFTAVVVNFAQLTTRDYDDVPLEILRVRKPSMARRLMRALIAQSLHRVALLFLWA